MGISGGEVYEYAGELRTKKGPDPKIQALVIPGGAERDRTVGLLNAIPGKAPDWLKISHEIKYPDDASGD
ncbi:MAG: hypothetical protein ACYC47_03840 [Desulfobacteria bacterium]